MPFPSATLHFSNGTHRQRSNTHCTMARILSCCSRCARMTRDDYWQSDQSMCRSATSAESSARASICLNWTMELRGRSSGTGMTTFERELTVHSDSPEATMRIGRGLGRACEPGLVIGLIGPLGAGKTQLLRGLTEGLEVPDSRAVSSPTFVLVQEYFGRLPIYHFDTYRLTSAEQFSALGP